jgi:hypothetical protein
VNQATHPKSTNDGGAARRFQNQVQVGMVGINVPTSWK